MFILSNRRGPKKVEGRPNPPPPSTQPNKSEMTELMSHRYIAQCALDETEAYRTTFDAISGGAFVLVMGEFATQVGGVNDSDYLMTGAVRVSPLLLATYDEIVTVIHAACKTIQTTAVEELLVCPNCDFAETGAVTERTPSLRVKVLTFRALDKDYVADFWLSDSGLNGLVLCLQSDD